MKCFISVVFRGDVLLGSFCQLIKVWGAVVSAVVGSVALGSCQGNGAVVIDGGGEDCRFPGELLLEKQIG